MTDPTPSSQIASQLRRYVDGELEAAEAASVRERIDADPALRAAVDHEQALRARVADALASGTPAAPAGLAERVRAAMRAEPVGATEPAPVRTAPVRTVSVPTGTDRPAPDRWRWLVGPERANVFAVAAVLAIVVGAVVISLRLPKIDHWGRSAPESNLAADTTRFLEEEHGRCATSPDHLELKLAWCASEQAESEIEQFLGVASFEAPDLSASGYSFAGAGRCCVPGEERSVHMLYRCGGGTGRTKMASMWVVPDHGQFDGAITAAGGRWLSVSPGPGCTHDVWCRSDGRLVYFLLCCDDRDLSLVATGLAGSGR